MYGWLLNSIDREYAVIHVLKDSPRGSVRLIRHEALGKRLILRRFQGSGEVYRQLMGYVCGNPLQIYETAEQDGEVLVLEEFIEGGTLGLLLEEALFSPFSNPIDVTLEQYVGPLRRRLHPAHLHPRNPSGPESSCRDHGKFHITSHVAKNKIHSTCQKRGEVPIQTSPLRRGSPYYGSAYGSNKNCKNQPAQNVLKQSKTLRNQAISEDFWSCRVDSSRRSNTVKDINQFFPTNLC